MADYSSRLSIRGAFEIDESVLIDLIGIIKDYVGKEPTIKIMLDGDHRIESPQILVLLGDPDVKSRLIRGISISARDLRDGVFRWVELELEPKLESAASLVVSGERDHGIAVRNQIETVLAGRRLWYSPLRATMGTFPGMIASVFAAYLAAFIIAGGLFVLLGIDLKRELASFGAFVLGGAIFGFGIYAYGRMFPKLTFDIGASKRVGKSARHWRQVIGIAVLLTMAVGIAVNFITARVLS